MKRWVAAAITLIALTLTGAASGAPPLRDRFEVDATFPADDLTAACGFPVTMTFTGTFSILVLGDREIDTQPATKITYAANGRSIALPMSVVLHATYPEGIAVGAPAIISLTGNGGGLGALGVAGTGRLVLGAVIVETDDGFAFTRFTGLISEAGRFTDQIQQICDALAGSA